MALRLSPEAETLIATRPNGWEYLLFAHVYIDTLESYADLRSAHRLGIALGDGATVDSSNVLLWIPARTRELQQIVDAVGSLFNKSLPEAFGESGHAGDPDAIVAVARQIGTCYRSFIEWAQAIRTAQPAYPAEASLLTALSGLAENSLSECESYGPRFLGQVEGALAAPVDGGQEIEIRLRLALGDTSRLASELATLKSRLET